MCTRKIQSSAALAISAAYGKLGIHRSRVPLNILRFSSLGVVDWQGPPTDLDLLDQHVLHISKPKNDTGNNLWNSEFLSGWNVHCEGQIQETGEFDLIGGGICEKNKWFVFLLKLYLFSIRQTQSRIRCCEAPPCLYIVFLLGECQGGADNTDKRPWNCEYKVLGI